MHTGSENKLALKIRYKSQEKYIEDVESAKYDKILLCMKEKVGNVCH